MDRDTRGSCAVDWISDRSKRDEPVVSIRGLDFAYAEGNRRLQVLFDINLDINPGEIVLLCGPSGCG